MQPADSAAQAEETTTVENGTASRTSSRRRPAATRGTLLRYRIMAFTTAVLLIVLVFVGVPLQVAAHQPVVVNVVGTIHGFLYIVYLLAAFSLTRRLRVPKLRTFLVLLAGTVPFAAFAAERSMTRRFDDAMGGSTAHQDAAQARTPVPVRERASAARQRWLSPRALVLHVEVLIIAPACALAGWWQATRALSGNELSWVYSIEWPIFALLAIGGWWQLIHEDPEAFRLRRWRSNRQTTSDAAPAEEPVAGAEPLVPVDVDAVTTRWSRVLAIAVAAEFALGVVALVVIPFGRPAGWVPAHGAALYGLHASVGLGLELGAVAFLVRFRRGGRIARIVGWTGAVGVAVSGLGGLMTEPQSITRFLGVALMFLGAAVAVGAYLIPTALTARSRTSQAASDFPAPLPTGGTSGT